MRGIDRVAVVMDHPDGAKWLDAGTKKQLQRRGWYSETFTSQDFIHYLPFIAIRVQPDGFFDRAVVVDAINRSLADVVRGESHDGSYLIYAVREGLDRLYLSIHHYCGAYPDTKAPGPPYLLNVDIKPEWATPADIEALHAYYLATAI